MELAVVSGVREAVVRTQTCVYEENIVDHIMCVLACVLVRVLICVPACVLVCVLKRTAYHRPP